MKLLSFLGLSAFVFQTLRDGWSDNSKYHRFCGHFFKIYFLMCILKSSLIVIIDDIGTPGQGQWLKNLLSTQQQMAAWFIRKVGRQRKEKAGLPFTCHVQDITVYKATPAKQTTFTWTYSSPVPLISITQDMHTHKFCSPHIHASALSYSWLPNSLTGCLISACVLWDLFRSFISITLTFLSQYICDCAYMHRCIHACVHSLLFTLCGFWGLQT